MSTEKIDTFMKLQEVFDKEMLLEDRNVLKLLCAVVIGNQLNLDPIWLMLVSAPSSGKTELLAAFKDLKFGGNQTIWPISDLSRNAFVSGQKKTGKETSLLHSMQPGSIMVFKDFTSLLSKNREDKAEILGQLREIFDKEYNKRVGTGDDLTWTGKVGAIAGCTESIFEHMEDVAAMGERFMLYSMRQPDRKKVIEFVLNMEEKGHDFEKGRERMRNAITEFLQDRIMANMKGNRIELSPETKKDVISVADFCTRARSAVIVDQRRDRINYVPSPEMPIRILKQLLALAQAMVAMRQAEVHGNPEYKDENKLTEEELGILFKVAFDSIPIKRRIALRYLTQFKQGITTAGFATQIGYQTNVTSMWLQQLAALAICDREKSKGPQGDTWKIRPEYRDIMERFEHIKVMDGELRDDKRDEEAMMETDEGWLALESSREMSEMEEAERDFSGELFPEHE